MSRATAIGGAIVLLSAAAIGAGCGGGSGGGSATHTIRIDGSSTVAPLSESAAERFQKQRKDVSITVGTSGTGGGMEKLCKGEIDIADASRQMEPDEKAACTKAGIEVAEIQVANDGIAVVTGADNDFLDCLTTAQLRKIWDQGSKVAEWSAVDGDFPDEEVQLFGPGTDSGTFDFFTKAVNGEEGRSRSDYNASEDDNVLVQGVGASGSSLGYFGLSYAEQNAKTLKLVGVDSGAGCITPSTKTVQDGTYAPLSRPLYVYATKKIAATAWGKDFLDDYVASSASIAKDALFVPMTDEQVDAATAAVKAATVDSAT